MACTTKKIVVFDLDETLGYFLELGMFWDSLQYYLDLSNINLSLSDQELFDKLLDLYPEFLRPNIFDILNYLYEKKVNNHCNKLMIYTNNQGPESWVKKIMHYFENKLGEKKIFDQIIAAFKVQGKQVELCRTTHLKTHSDLIKCTKLPTNTQICFLDDVYYPDMSNDNIYYINVKPYIHDLAFEEMIQRFVTIFESFIANKEEFKIFMQTNMARYHYIYQPKTEIEKNVDKSVSKKILFHLQQFFKQRTNKTKRRKHMSKHSMTRKK
jgi:hypothetical protein